MCPEVIITIAVMMITIIMFLELPRGSHSSSCSNSNDNNNVPRGIWGDVPAQCILAGVSIWHLSHGCTQQAPKHQAFLSACVSLGSPHCMCCAQHMWTRQAFAEKLATSIRFYSFPPLSALIRISPEGLIIYALKEDIQYCLGFI